MDGSEKPGSDYHGDPLRRVFVPKVLAIDANGVEMFKTLDNQIYARTTDGVIHRYPPKVRGHKKSKRRAA